MLEGWVLIEVSNLFLVLLSLLARTLNLVGLKTPLLASWHLENWALIDPLWLSIGGCSEWDTTERFLLGFHCLLYVITVGSGADDRQRLRNRYTLWTTNNYYFINGSSQNACVLDRFTLYRTKKIYTFAQLFHANVPLDTLRSLGIKNNYCVFSENV